MVQGLLHLQGTGEGKEMFWELNQVTGDYAELRHLMDDVIY